MSLQRALLLLIALSLLAGLVPAGLILDRRLAASLEEKAREGLAVAPPLLNDREVMRADAMTMHAKDLAGTAGLAEALRRDDRAFASRLAQAARESFDEQGIVVDREGGTWIGPQPALEMLEATRLGQATVQLVQDGRALMRVALAPVAEDGVWLGAAGVAKTIDEATAGTLAGLTRSEVVILLANGQVAASTADPTLASTLAAEAVKGCSGGVVRELARRERPHYLMTCAPLENAAAVVFARNLDQELGVLPQLRRVAAIAGLFALTVALLLGAILAAMLARPVRSLAGAADRLAAGDFDAPLEDSSVREIERLAGAFADMRNALAARLTQVQEANRELADRQRRMAALQAELIQRDRLAASGRLVTELAHEIRNPVANVRNCLEIISRRVEGDATASRFADLAIDELLRMHELAERMLDLHRPGDATTKECDVTTVAHEVAALVRAGASGQPLEVEVSGEEGTLAAIQSDSLKQVLLNLVQNAREALGDDGRIELSVARRGGEVVLDVSDDGPGIPEEILPRVFDPFFTTKGSVQGVGLGLFVAEGIIRSHGGRVSVTNRDGGGAHFRIELPAPESAAAHTSTADGKSEVSP